MAQTTTPVSVTTWYEINTPDKTKALDFYKNVLGWTTSDMDMGEHGMYTMLHSADGAFAGSMEMTGPEWEGIPAHWMIYFRTSNLGETMDKVKANGGEIVYDKFSIPGVGDMCVCKDDSGAVFSLHEPEPSQADSNPADGGVNWMEFVGKAPGQQNAEKFYSAVFGWEVRHQDMADGTYSMFFIGDMPVCGAMNLPPEVNAPAHWLVYLHTDNITEACANVAGQGGTVMNGPFPAGEYGMIAICQDPTGAVFGLHMPPSA
ncbi:VOC family protein [Kamptonema cortianum]|nr:VOC family protein [Geitlerinema splendidum]MDK3158662.1 VOC family protein [Kamptonema cortianum]